MAGMVCVRHVWGLIGGSSKGEPGIQWRGEEMGCVRRREGELMFVVGGERGGAGWAVVGWRVRRRRGRKYWCRELGRIILCESLRTRVIISAQ